MRKSMALSQRNPIPSCSCLKRPYIYKHLAEEDDVIRLIALLPGNKDDKLQCRMLASRIKQKLDQSDRLGSYFQSEVDYKALSYTWAPIEPRGCIELDGCCLILGANLFAALLNLRSTHRSLILWIDAICINQRDISERGHQVSLMRSIYSSAQEIIVWLGQTVQDERLPLLLKSIPWQTPYPTLSHVSFLRSPWFARTWILQEAVLAAKISFRYGGEAVGWEDVQRTAQGVRQHYIDDATNERLAPGLDHMSASAKVTLSILKWRRTLQSQELSHSTPRLQLEDVIYEIRHSECSDPRDMIFAALSLAPGTNGSPLFFPNYRLSLREFQDMLAKSSISEYKSLNILSFVEHTETSIPLPSWSPRWQFGSTTARIKHISGDISDENFEPFSLLSDFTLSLNCAFLLKIECVTEQPIGLFDDPNYTVLSAGVIVSAGDNALFTSYKEGPWCQIAHRRHSPANAFLTSAASYYQAQRSRAQLLPWESYKVNIKAILPGRRLAMTDGKYTAIVPGSTRPGDEIVAVYGTRNCFVVRASKGHEDHATKFESFLLIGACEVDATMDWDLFKSQYMSSTKIILE